MEENTTSLNQPPTSNQSSYSNPVPLSLSDEPVPTATAEPETKMQLTRQTDSSGGNRTPPPPVDCDVEDNRKNDPVKSGEGDQEADKGELFSGQIF
jgi:hypothetical protein